MDLIERLQQVYDDLRKGKKESENASKIKELETIKGQTVDPKDREKLQIRIDELKELVGPAPVDREAYLRKLDVELGMLREKKLMLETTFNRLKKFQMLTTKVKSLDDQILQLCGHWMKPSEERNAIRLELARKKGEALPHDGYLDRRLMLLKGVHDSSAEYTPYFDVPTPGQVVICTLPVFDSGQYKITLSQGKLVRVCMVTKKRLGTVENLESFLSHFFHHTIVRNILQAFNGG